MKQEQDLKLHKIRHSLSHLMAAAVLEKFPKAKLGIGPVIENGFYYDFDITTDKHKDRISENELKIIENRVQELIKMNLIFEKKKVTYIEAKKLFSSDRYKLELIEELKKKKSPITIYETYIRASKKDKHKIVFIDLCSGPHIKNSKEIDTDAFKLTHVAGAYWRGSEKNKMLTRIYGVAFSTKKELDEYLKMLEGAEKRDHRKLGKELNLFVFSEIVGKGLPLWTEDGTTIRRELERFIVDEEIKRGYKHVVTPDIAKIDLYKKSGHYPYYKDSMYAPIKIENEEYMLRPMTCPHHFELYLSKPRSYRDLPMRIAELAKLYRYEKSGELTGLMRVRSFCLADAHVICADENQAAEEVGGALDLIEYIAHTFGLKIGKDYWYRLSLGDRKNSKKYFKDDKAWNRAEKELRKVLKQRKSIYEEAKDEAAFYGPKIDIQMKNVLGKDDTAFTVQYDFVMPKRFSLVYTNKNGKEKEVIVVHRSSIGAIERSIALLIEHYAGAFPAWLSPTQVTVLPVGEKFVEYANSIAEKLKQENIRVEIIKSNETLGKRIREAELRKIPYTLVVGEKEIKNDSVNVRSYKNGQLGEIKTSNFVEKITKEIRDKK